MMNLETECHLTTSTIMISDIKKDPFGLALQDFLKGSYDENILVYSELCDEDVIPVDYLFRSYQEMPKMEQTALNMATGRILDVGAGAGCHAKYLHEKGQSVFAIDISETCVKHYESMGIPSACIDFFELDQKFDTILFLMNGIGLGGKLDRLTDTIAHAKKLLNPGGQILCDSSDIKYLYEEEDGSFWVDLNSKYYGEFKFQTKYKDAVSEWFEWLYVDFDNLQKAAENCGMTAEKVIDGTHFDYLAKIS